VGSSFMRGKLLTRKDFSQCSVLLSTRPSQECRDNDTTPAKESFMSTTMLRRGIAILAVVATTLVFTTAALAQMPPSPWKKGAPFPEPDEELYGVAVNGKLYVIGGWDEGKARGANYKSAP